MFFQPKRAEVLRRCGDGLVVDVGGWADPFHRADHVLDGFDHGTRGFLHNGVGRLADNVRHPVPLPGERSTRETWRTQDICGTQPFPFPDKVSDFVICSHTLEDIRDPLRVCGELIRLAKPG
jgi:SAM-dependent methyltransferase